MLNHYEESPLPGWTGLNIMLYEAEIPKASRIGYLPVIDNSPTEYSTINAILENGVNILQQADRALRRVSYHYVLPVGNIKTI